MAKWKYQNPEKRRRYTDYSNKLYLENNKPVKIVINNWEFTKATTSARPLFKCFVEKENGEDVDKTWAIWDQELTEALKKKLKGKKPHSDKVKLTVTKHGEKFEETYDLS